MVVVSKLVGQNTKDKSALTCQSAYIKLRKTSWHYSVASECTELTRNTVSQAKLWIQTKYVRSAPLSELLLSLASLLCSERWFFPCPPSSNGPLVIDCNYCPAHDTSSSALTTISSWLFTTDSRYADNGSTTRTEHVTEHEDHACTHKRPLVACTKSSTLLCLERRISISVMIAQQLIPLPVSTRSISVSPDCSNVRGQEHF